MWYFDYFYDYENLKMHENKKKYSIFFSGHLEMTKISESRRNSRFLWLFRSLFCDLTNEPIWLLKRRTVLSALVYVVTRSTSSSGASQASLEKWNGNHHQAPNVVLLPLDPKKCEASIYASHLGLLWLINSSMRKLPPRTISTYGGNDLLWHF